MNVLLLNGSPKANGNTALALQEMIKVFDENGIETTLVQVGSQAIRGCIACNSCKKNYRCIFDDAVNETALLLDKADGLVIATPVYYGSANGTLISFLDRLFYSSGAVDKRMKVGASIAIARRGGTTATFDELNKYFTISAMPIASSTYWNNVHGSKPGEAAEDLEGLQVMRNLATNMIFLMKSIALGKERYGLPDQEKAYHTNFIH